MFVIAMMNETWECTFQEFCFFFYWFGSKLIKTIFAYVPEIEKASKSLGPIEKICCQILLRI